ncbi:MAG: preprotein translocase subunit SecE [Cyanobacteria bacterium NC_groundwater_1444_Ag_S-0.65um_54_12]|nr:preprotein translocase subunit SecE [Cyanobacteria bacterium NC_groundwater_1444_Ag_S-0.65um_54_12]
MADLKPPNPSGPLPEGSQAGFRDDSEAKAGVATSEEKSGSALAANNAENRALGLKGIGIPAFGGKFRSIQIFLTEVQAEFKKISWPTRRQVIVETVVVIFVCAILTGLVVAYDWFFTLAANKIFYGQ